MRELLDTLIRRWFEQDPAAWAWTQWIHAVGMLLVAGVLVLFAALFAGWVSWFERRVAGRMQSRIGPNRVGPIGILQFVADALKLLFKEDLIPKDADRVLFRIAPYFVMTGFCLTFAVLPFGYRLSATTMNVGLFYVASVTALVVVGILLSGWSSNSKWSLFGGIRAAAQVVSYEIPAGLMLLIPIVMAGSLDLQQIIRAQGGPPWDWYMFQTPWAFAAFFIMFTSLLAEGNRTPFDLPEGESELVGGYHTEYSGIRFALFLLAEWGNLWVMSALVTTLFVGGWQVPFVGPERLAGWEAAGAVPVWFYLISAAIFIAKTLAFVFVVVWIRWTLPRIRVDQMMSLCWKYLVPAGIVLVLLAAVTEWGSFEVFGEAAKGHAATTSPRGLLHVGFFAVAGLVPFVLFIAKTFRNIRYTGDKVDLTNW